MRKTVPDLVETSPGSNVFMGSGYVFIDLGLPDADLLHNKMRMVVTISRTLEARKLSTKRAAKLLSTTQKNIRLIHRLAIDEFSFGCLMRFANSLDYEVIVALRPRASARELDVDAA